MVIRHDYLTKRKQTHKTNLNVRISLKQESEKKININYLIESIL